MKWSFSCNLGRKGDNHMITCTHPSPSPSLPCVSFFFFGLLFSFKNRRTSFRSHAWSHFCNVSNSHTRNLSLRLSMLGHLGLIAGPGDLAATDPCTQLFSFGALLALIATGVPWRRGASLGKDTLTTPLMFELWSLLLCSLPANSRLQRIYIKYYCNLSALLSDNHNLSFLFLERDLARPLGF